MHTVALISNHNEEKKRCIYTWTETHDKRQSRCQWGIMALPQKSEIHKPTHKHTLKSVIICPCRTHIGHRCTTNRHTQRQQIPGNLSWPCNIQAGFRVFVWKLLWSVLFTERLWQEHLPHYVQVHLEGTHRYTHRDTHTLSFRHGHNTDVSMSHSFTLKISVPWSAWAGRNSVCASEIRLSGEANISILFGLEPKLWFVFF